MYKNLSIKERFGVLFQQNYTSHKTSICRHWNSAEFPPIGGLGFKYYDPITAQDSIEIHEQYQDRREKDYSGFGFRTELAYNCNAIIRL